MNVLVYSANFNKYDKLKEPFPEGFDYLLYTNTEYKTKVWQTSLIQIKEEPKRACNYFKLRSTQVAKKYDATIWLDASLKQIKPIKELVEDFLNSDAEIKMCTHRWRNCVYEEGQVCIDKKRDSKEVIEAQMNRYKNLNFPKNLGMYETTIMLRKNTPKCADFERVWYDEYIRHSKRDQLSIMYAKQKTGIRIDTFDFNLNTNPYFKKIIHGR